MRMRVLRVAAWICIVLGLCMGWAEPGSATSSGIEDGWSLRLRMMDLNAGVLDVELVLPPTLRRREPLPFCLFMDGAGAFVRDVRLVDPAMGAQIAADAEDSDCWDVRPSKTGGWPRALAYRVDLKAMAARHGEPDYAEHIAATYVWNEQAVLMHPRPLPAKASIQIELSLPPATPYAVPWVEVPAPAGSSHRLFHSDAHQHDMGSYVVFGTRLRALGTLSLPAAKGNRPTGAHARLFLIDLPHRAGDDAIRAWMQGALGAVSSFYGDLMPKDVVVTLVPIGNSNDPGIYGSVLRPLRPSAVIFFGGRSDQLNLRDDWLATHELFHIGNPFIKGRLPWLIEGFTTYYQEVLRARAGAVRAEQTWDDLVRVLGRYCQPQDGRSLADDSRDMRKTHRYQRVYWGGACIALGLDLAIRTRASQSAARPVGASSPPAFRSLDDVLHQLRKDSLRQPLTEQDILATLDAAAGDRMATRLLNETRSIPLPDWLHKLGVRSNTDGKSGPFSANDAILALDDRAPWAAVRRALF